MLPRCYTETTLRAKVILVYVGDFMMATDLRNWRQIHYINYVLMYEIGHQHPTVVTNIIRFQHPSSTAVWAELWVTFC